MLRPPALSVRGCVLDLAGDPIGGLVVCILDATAIFGWHTVEEFVDGREPELKNSMKIRGVVTSQSVDPLANVKVVRGLETFRTPSFGSFRPRGKAITDAQPAFALSCPVADVELHVAGGCVVGLTQPREVARTLVVLRGDEEVARRPDDLGQVEVDVVR